jgi:hypothetical protein
MPPSPTYRIVQGNLAAGDYFIKATDAAGSVFGVSRTFRVHGGMPKRKLYGPLMVA